MRMMRLLPLCCATLLMGCAASAPPAPTVVTRVEMVRMAPPVELLTCPDIPQEPVRDARGDVAQSAIAEYLALVHRAWADCRDRLGAVRDWVAGD